MCHNTKKGKFLYSAVSSPRDRSKRLHFTSLTDLFTQTPYRLLWEASSHMLELMREGCSYTYPPLSIARYSFIQLSELEQCRVKKLAQGFNPAAQDFNPGSCSRKSEALPLSHCALLTGVGIVALRWSLDDVFCGIVLSCPVLSCPVLSCPVLSCPVLSCPVLSCPVLSCPVLSCPVLSCPVLSCPVLSCPALPCPALPCPVLSCPALPCPVLSRGCLKCGVAVAYY